MSEDNTEQHNEMVVNRVSLRPPLFWKGDFSIWFALVEAQFALCGIINDPTKYHVVSALDTEILT